MWAVPFDAVEISASGSATSQPVRLWDGKNDHAMEYAITGDGVLSLTVYTSISGKEWISNGVKGSSLGKTSGPGSDGKDNIPLSLKPGEFIRFVATETGGAATATLILWFTQK